MKTLTSSPKTPPLPAEVWCKGCYVYKNKGLAGGIWDYAYCYSVCWHRELTKNDKLTDKRV